MHKLQLNVVLSSSGTELSANTVANSCNTGSEPEGNIFTAVLLGHVLHAVH